MTSSIRELLDNRSDCVIGHYPETLGLNLRMEVEDMTIFSLHKFLHVDVNCEGTILQRTVNRRGFPMLNMYYVKCSKDNTTECSDRNYSRNL